MVNVTIPNLGRSYAVRMSPERIRELEARRCDPVIGALYVDPPTVPAGGSLPPGLGGESGSHLHGVVGPSPSPPSGIVGALTTPAGEPSPMVHQVPAGVGPSIPCQPVGSLLPLAEGTHLGPKNGAPMQREQSRDYLPWFWAIMAVVLVIIGVVMWMQRSQNYTTDTSVYNRDEPPARIHKTSDPVVSEYTIRALNREGMS